VSVGAERTHTHTQQKMKVKILNVPAKIWTRQHTPCTLV